MPSIAVCSGGRRAQAKPVPLLTARSDAAAGPSHELVRGAGLGWKPPDLGLSWATFGLPEPRRLLGRGGEEKRRHYDTIVVHVELVNMKS